MIEENKTVAWHCKFCGRIETPRGEQYCPECGKKMQRCSRYEWFLSDALRTILSHLGAEFNIQEQYEVSDHRGFSWYFDLYVWVKGKSIYGGYAELIEVNGDDHRKRKRPMKDLDKYLETLNSLQMHKYGMSMRVVKNEQCARRKVFETAIDIADELIERSNSWC